MPRVKRLVSVTIFKLIFLTKVQHRKAAEFASPALYYRLRLPIQIRPQSQI